MHVSKEPGVLSWHSSTFFSATTWTITCTTSVQGLHDMPYINYNNNNKSSVHLNMGICQQHNRIILSTYCSKFKQLYSLIIWKFIRTFIRNYQCLKLYCSIYTISSKNDYCRFLLLNTPNLGQSWLYVTRFCRKVPFSRKKFDPFLSFDTYNFYLLHIVVSEIFHAWSYSIWLHFDTKSNLITKSSLLLQYFVCQYDKCVEKVPFSKSSHTHTHTYTHTHTHTNTYKHTSMHAQACTYTRT